jgi:hypothetical protein
MLRAEASLIGCGATHIHSQWQQQHQSSRVAAAAAAEQQQSSNTNAHMACMHLQQILRNV